MNTDLYNLSKEQFLLYEHKYYDDPEGNVIVFSCFNDDKILNVEEKDFNNRIANNILDFINNTGKKVIVTWGSYSKEKFDSAICRGFDHLDLMQCYMLMLESDSYLSLAEVFRLIVSANDHIDKYSDIFTEMDLLRNRIFAIDYLMFCLLTQDESYLPDHIKSAIQKYKIEKEIEMEIIEERTRRRL